MSSTRTTNPLPLEFNSVHADVVLRSSDGTEYRMAKATLAQASPFFEQMFSLPQPEDADERSDGLPVIPLTEPVEVLDVLLRFCIPRPPPKLDDLSVVLHVFEGAKKYHLMKWAHVAANEAFARVAQEDPLRCYAQACKHGLKDETRIAATFCMRLSLDDILNSGASKLEGMSGVELLHLFRYRKRCGDAVAARLLSWAWLREYYASPGVAPGDKVWYFECCTESTTRMESQGTTPITSTLWWHTWMMQTVENLKDCTWEGAVRVEDAMTAFIQSGSCDRCCDAAPRDLTEFTQHMAAVVKNIVAQVTQKFWTEYVAHR